MADENIFKAWEYVDEDGSVIRLTEEDKNELLAQDPSAAQYLRRHVYTDEEKDALRYGLAEADLKGNLHALARSFFPKAMREWELNEERGDTDWKSLARQGYAGAGDLGNMASRLVYEAVTGEPASEDYGAEGLNEGEKSAAWHLSRDKWALPLLLATRGKSLGSTAATGAMAGGALAAAPIGIDAIAHKYLGVETVPSATKENPLQAAGMAAGIGGAVGGAVGKFGGLLGRAGAQKVGEVLANLSPKAREVVESGLANVARTAAKSERPVSVARQFDAAASAIEGAAMTEAQKAEAKAALAEVQKILEEDVFAAGGKMRAPATIKEAVENVASEVEGKGSVSKEAVGKAKGAIVSQLEKAPLNRVNSSLKEYGVSLTQSELDEILALKAGEVPSTPATRGILERIATRLGKSGWDAVAVVQSLASGGARTSAAKSAAPKSLPKGLAEEGKKEGGE
jgi:hypothetical protein